MNFLRSIKRYVTPSHCPICSTANFHRYETLYKDKISNKISMTFQLYLHKLFHEKRGSEELRKKRIENIKNYNFESEPFILMGLLATVLSIFLVMKILQKFSEIDNRLPFLDQ
jgi:hypothetical protein